MNFSPVEIAKKLIQIETITPHNNGILTLIQSYLEAIGFKCTKYTFAEEGETSVDNLYASFGVGKPSLLFVGHCDVVPVGDFKSWRFSPFAAEEKDGKIYGRGAVDMKSAIASFIGALANLDTVDFKGSLHLIITCDEEGVAINGTKKVLEKLDKEGISFDAALIGEPTSENYLGDTIKIGRRGSINFIVECQGIQSHVAYSKKENNPFFEIIQFLQEVQNLHLDNGNNAFIPSNLEIVGMHSSSQVFNMVPALVSAMINIRFNDNFTPTMLEEKLQNIAKKYHNITIKVDGNPSCAFVTGGDSSFVMLVKQAIYEVTKKDVVTSTGGGTSDARFVKDFCQNVVELGQISKTAHMVDEHVAIKDIEILQNIYSNILDKFLK